MEAGKGGPSGGARVSGVCGGALRRGQRRLPIAHNETALSAGSGAVGKHGEGTQPGQKEAEDSLVGGECFERLLPRHSQIHLWGGSLVGSRVSRVEGGPGPGVMFAPSSAGLFTPIAGIGDPPGQQRRVRIFTLCQTLREQE